MPEPPNPTDLAPTPPRPPYPPTPPRRGLSARLRRLVRQLLPKSPFRSSARYWEQRYRLGGDSGIGSYGRLAVFKAEIVNAFVAKHELGSIIEFGCGDGSQLALASYPSYTGLDVSPEAIRRCFARFAGDAAKRFVHYDPTSFEAGHTVARADAALSLDVIYHLIEDLVFETYMAHLFASAERFVIIYASNTDEPVRAPHVRHRRFTDWIEANRPDWSLVQHVPNRYPHDAETDEPETSFAEFFMFERSSGSASANDPSDDQHNHERD